MNGFKGRGFADMISSVGSMLLFLLFAACMLIIIATAASTYSHINADFEQTFSSSASLRYVSNKIKSAESTEILDGNSGLALQYDEYVSVVYFADGGLYEKNLPSGSDISADGGDRIFDIGSMEITEADGLYTITVGIGGDISDVIVRKG